MSQSPFADLGLHPALLENLASLGYQAMTPIQAQSLPPILKGRDVIAQGKTGSGKTAAFGLGLLQKLEVNRFFVQSLVLCPTRELANQVAREIRKLARTIHNIKVLSLCGGTPFGPQVGSLAHGAHIVVGTPGRIEEHLRKGTLKPDKLTTLVLDEADRMLDMGFQPALDAIIDHLPQQRQTLLLSATYPEQIQSIATRIMSHPLLVRVASTHDNDSIQQHFYQLDKQHSRLTALHLLLLQYRPLSALVFCNTKQETREVAGELRSLGFSALALHGDLEQRDRDQTLVQFANNSTSILVATDVAARGLDIDSLDAVINYRIPRNSDTHVHRIGRTGRAGAKGLACTLHAEKEAFRVARLEQELGQTITVEPLPDSSVLQQTPYQPPMASLQIGGGRKQKLRPGDILGALTGKDGIDGEQVGKIDLFDHCAYVAVRRGAVRTALRKLERGKLKGRSFRVRALGDSLNPFE